LRLAVSPLFTSIRLSRGRGTTARQVRFVDQFAELIEEIGGVVRPRSCLGMILYAEYRVVSVAHPLDGAVIQVDVRNFYFGRQGIRIHRKSVILRRDRDLAGNQVFHRLIPTSVAKL